MTHGTLSSLSQNFRPSHDFRRAIKLDEKNLTLTNDASSRDKQIACPGWKHHL
jgi:hypothetical protein